MNFVERDDMIYDAGASVAVTYDGELVVDLWGGTIDTDADRNVPWERDTIINVWSTTKTVSAPPVSCWPTAANSTSTHPWRYWPEFKAGGKGEIEVRHVMSHTAGLAMVGTAARRGAVRLGAGDVDPCRPGALVAAGDGVGLPADTGLPRRRAGAADHGADVRPVRRRTGHRTARGRFPHRHVGRARRPHRPRHSRRPRSASSPAPATRRSPGGRSRICDFEAGAANTTAWRRAGSLPAAMGTPAQSPSCTPPWRAAARPMACGCCHRKASSRCSTSSATGKTSCCRSSCAWDRFRAALPRDADQPERALVLLGGWGGSLAVIDLDTRLTIAYVMNKMGSGTTGDMRGAGLILATYLSLAG